MNPLISTAAAATATMDHTALVAGLRSKDDSARAEAIANASRAGAPVIGAVCPLLEDTNNEVFRAAKRALLGIVRHAGAGGALAKEAQAVENALLTALGTLKAAQARRDTIWLLSEVGADKTVLALAALLTDKDVREDARCALERIPGKTSLKALNAALKTAPADFKPALAESLRKRGEAVRDIPSQRLVPTKTTEVKPGGA